MLKQKHHPLTEHQVLAAYIALPNLNHLKYLLQYTEKKVIQKYQCNCFNACIFFCMLQTWETIWFI